MKNDELEKIGLSTDDLDWITRRVAAYFQDEVTANNYDDKSKDINIKDLTKVVKNRLNSADQLESIALKVAQQMRKDAALSCSGANPNCACASHRSA